jgi:hypothetical protein
VGDKTRGIYKKFLVSRFDKTDELGGKHHRCQYFVLDCSHDPHAKAALEAYEKSCREEYPLLAKDIRTILDTASFG